MGVTSGFTLRVVAGKAAGQVIAVAGPELTPIKIGRINADPSRDIELIGRAADAERDLLLNADRQVSRVHAKIELRDGGYLLTDCESANRTHLNGRLLQPWEPVPLHDGDELRFGPESMVRFELHSATDAEHAHVVPPPPPVQSQTGKRGDRTSPRRGDDTPPAPPPQEVWSKFAVVATLSQNPVARVQLARARDRDAPVVLKRIVRSQLSSKARSALLTSAQKSRAWKHASIAEVLEHGEEGDFIFVVSRWIDGKSLYDLQLAYADEVEIPLAIHLTRDICAALRHGQSVERGFVWRNLNPHNVVVDREGHAVLVNFGLPSVRSLAEGRDHTDTPEARYLSPEQRRGKETDARSDLYSAGVILYELLGRGPVDAKQNVLKDAVGLRPDIPWDAADVANKAVAYRPERRFIHAADMEEALGAVLLKLYPGYASEPATWMANRLSSDPRPV